MSFVKIQDVIKHRPHAFVERDKVGDCRVCGNHTDIHCGFCFHCSGKVLMDHIEGGVKVTEIMKPCNVWYSPNH